MAHLYGKQSDYLTLGVLSNHLMVKRYVYTGFVLYPIVFALTLIWQPDFLVLIACFGVAALAIVLFRNKINYFAKKRDNFRNGRTAEGRAWYLLKELPYTFHVFQDIKGLNGLRGNIDFVVVGPTGIFTIEVKSHHGTIGFNGRHLTRNGWRFFDKDFLVQARNQSKAVSNFIKLKVMKPTWVHPIVTFTSAQTQIRIPQQEVSGVRIIRGNELVTFLQVQQIVLNNHEVEHIVNDVFCESGYCVQ